MLMIGAAVPFGRLPLYTCRSRGGSVVSGIAINVGGGMCVVIAGVVDVVVDVVTWVWASVLSCCCRSCFCAHVLCVYGAYTACNHAHINTHHIPLHMHDHIGP